MRIQSLSFSQNKGLPEEWSLSCSDIFDVNLIVAQNGTGKSRTVNVITYLFNLISGRAGIQPNSFFEYDVVFFDEASNDRFNYSVKVKNSNVVKESLEINGTSYLSRVEKEAQVYFKQLNSTITSSIDMSKFAIAQTDEIQKDYLIPLTEFSKQALLVQFGTDLGQRTFTANGIEGTPIELIDDSRLSIYTNSIVSFFHFAKAFKIYDELCESIKSDMNAIGYSIESVELEENTGGLVNGKPLDKIYVKETDLQTNTYQDLMSQGMFRAFGALAILNYLDITNKSGALLIDDIGEGLDFERSSKLIEIIIERCSTKNIQCLLSSNDKFVMNKIPLNYWQIISRSGHHCNMINHVTHPSPFEEFSIVGLNNFDFFSTKYYE